MTDSIENNQQPAAENKPEPKKFSWKRLWKEWILPFGAEIIVLWLLVRFVFFLPIIPTGSMEPTIREHSLLFAWRVNDVETLERGDIVVFDSEEIGKNLIKRLIGLPGDTVVIGEDGSLTINGEAYPEDYVVNQMALPGEYHVPEGCYLFFGDNRANSLDARYWNNSYIPAENISGRAVFTLFPFSNFGKLE